MRISLILLNDIFFLVIFGRRSRETTGDSVVCWRFIPKLARARTRTTHPVVYYILYYIRHVIHTSCIYRIISAAYLYTRVWCARVCVFFKARRIKSRHICGLPSRLGVRARASASTSVSSSRGLDHTPLRRLAWVSALSFLLRYIRYNYNNIIIYNNIAHGHMNTFFLYIRYGDTHIYTSAGTAKHTT